MPKTILLIKSDMIKFPGNVLGFLFFVFVYLVLQTDEIAAVAGKA